MATNGWRIFDYLIKNRIKVDRVILLSDMQCWNTGGGWYCDKQMAPYFRKYRDSVNPKVILHSVDLQGHGDSVVPADEKNVNLVSGFSEKILSRLTEFEGIGTKEGRKLPTIEYVRENF
jgi:hypothetical protein